MKREYYHCYPICPSCFAPSKIGSYIKIDKNENELLKCTCNSVYYKRFNLSKFEDTLKIVDKKGEYENKSLRLPLLWKIDVNPLEKEYIKWLKTCSSGNYLVTWPWNEVKFIPIAISEFIFHNPNKKVVVIGNINNNKIFNDDNVSYPENNLAFNSLLYLDQIRNKIGDFKELRKEKNSFRDRNIFKLINKFQCKIKVIGAGDVEIEEYDASIFNNSIITCKNKTKKWINEQYGNNVIKQVKRKRIGKEWKYDDKNLNSNGFINISVEEVEEYPVLRYNNNILWNILLNIEHLDRVNKRLSSKTVLSKSDLDFEGDYNVFFVSDLINPEFIFNFLKKISPDLIIFPDIDNFILYARKEFHEFFKNNQNISLMFSTDPNKRTLMEINFVDGFIENNGITVHTWDSSIIMNELFKFHEFNNNKFNPFSSVIKELPDYGKMPDVGYVNVESLDLLAEISPRIINVFKGIPQIKEYLNDLEKTPLMVRGDPLDKTVFKRSNFSLNTIVGAGT